MNFFHKLLSRFYIHIYEDGMAWRYSFRFKNEVYGGWEQKTLGGTKKSIIKLAQRHYEEARKTK